MPLSNNKTDSEPTYRCRICGAPVLSQVDKSQPSERVDWMGTDSKEAIGGKPKKPTKLWMFPSKPVGDLCFYHRNFKGDKKWKSYSVC